MMAGAYEGAPTMGQKLDYILMNVFSGEGEAYEHIFRVIQVYTSEPGVQYLELDEEWARPYLEEMYAFVYRLIEYFLFYRYNQYDGPFTRSARRRAFGTLFDAYMQKQSDLEHALLHQFDDFLTEVIENPKLVVEIIQNQVGVGTRENGTEEIWGALNDQMTTDVSGTGRVAAQDFFISNAGVILTNLVGGSFSSGFVSLCARISIPIGGHLVGNLLFRSLMNRFGRESTDEILTRLKNAFYSALDVNDLYKDDVEIDDSLKQNILAKKRDEENLNGLWFPGFRLNSNERGKIRMYNDTHKPYVEEFRKDAYALLDEMYKNESDDLQQIEKDLAENIKEGFGYPSFSSQYKKELFSQLLRYYHIIKKKQESELKNVRTKFIKLFPNPIPLQASLQQPYVQPALALKSTGLGRVPVTEDV